MDCLITKLKGSVQNENLPLLGTLKINVKYVQGFTSYSIYFANDEVVTIRIEGDGVMSPNEDLHDPRTEQGFGVGARSYYFSPGNYTICIENKYALTVLSTTATSDSYDALTLNVEDLEFSERLTALILGGASMGNINVLRTELLATLRIYHCKDILGVSELLPRLDVLDRFELVDNPVSVNLDFSNNTALTILNLRGSVGVSGSILSLASATGLSTVNIRYTQIEGELTDLADLMVQHRNSGTLVIQEGNAKVTCYGQTFDGSSKTITFSNGSYTIS